MTRATRLFAVTLLTAALGACSDAPLAPTRANDDPAVAAANHILGSAARVHEIQSSSRGGRQSGPLASRSGKEPSQLTSSSFPPFYCNDPSDSPYCPQIIVGAAVWDNGTDANGSRIANLYSHLDADNVTSSTLTTHYEVGGGCGGGTLIFATDEVSGGSGGPYAMVAQKIVTFSGGPVTYRVDAHGTAVSPYGSRGEDSAYASRCL